MKRKLALASWVVAVILSAVALLLPPTGYIDYSVLPQSADKPTSALPENANSKKRKRIEASQQREALKKATKHLSQNVEKLEAQVAELEQQLAQIDEQLANPETYKDSAKIKDLNCSKTQTAQTLETTIEAWMQAQADLDEAVAAFQN